MSDYPESTKGRTRFKVMIESPMCADMGPVVTIYECDRLGEFNGVSVTSEEALEVVWELLNSYEYGEMYTPAPQSMMYHALLLQEEFEKFKAARIPF